MKSIQFFQLAVLGCVLLLLFLVLLLNTVS